VASTAAALTRFALDVAFGLSKAPKQIPPQYFYDELGSALFEAITVLPEYGLTRADERLLTEHASEIAEYARATAVAELGSGSGRKTRQVLEAVRTAAGTVRYFPIDVSGAALDWCAKQIGDVGEVIPICDEWNSGLKRAGELRRGGEKLLVLFLGSSIGNMERRTLARFLREIKQPLRPGDLFLVGADLMKDPARMLAAYDDATGVTAAFNLNILARVNRELNGNFDLRQFAHEIRWNESERRIEMHLVSTCDQTVHVGVLGERFRFHNGESIWTESSHKFATGELESYGTEAGFSTVATWVDREWPFAEILFAA
jgi:dimethylhistidine N-methyltransferase